MIFNCSIIKIDCKSKKTEQIKSTIFLVLLIIMRVYNFSIFTNFQSYLSQATPCRQSLFSLLPFLFLEKLTNAFSSSFQTLNDICFSQPLPLVLLQDLISKDNWSDGDNPDPNPLDYEF